MITFISLLACIICCSSIFILSFFAGKEYAVLAMEIKGDNRLRGFDLQDEVKQDSLLPKQVMIMGIGSLFIMLFLWEAETTKQTLLMTLSFCGVSFIIPRMLRDWAKDAEKKEIQKGVPVSLDIIYLCLEAGMSIEKAFEQTAKELYELQPKLAMEMKQTVVEVKAGLTFSNALDRMAERLEIDELQNLANLVGQATRMGASIAQLMRQFADKQREIKAGQMEEKAGKVAAKMTFPLMLCFIPCIFLLIMTPPMLIFMQNF